MFDKLEDILFRYDEVLKELSEPEVLNLSLIHILCRRRFTNAVEQVFF